MIGGLWMIITDYYRRLDNEEEPGIIDLERDSKAITATLVLFLIISIVFFASVIYVSFFR